MNEGSGICVECVGIGTGDGRLSMLFMHCVPESAVRMGVWCVDLKSFS